MNKNKKPNLLFTMLISALLAAPALVPPLRAQSAQPMQSRYLFVFDTSSAMEKRVPAEVKGINEFFAITLNGELHPGDSIGAWAFSRELRTGEFPLELWQPQERSAIPLDIIGFVKDRHYSKSTRFDQLMPTLNQVVRSSPRLTTIIFCDGDGQISGTPVDAKFNSIFKQNKRAMKKAREPFIIILRSQFGQYVGFSINTPDNITLPPFPPLPPPPPAPIAAAPKPPPPSGPPPLVIIGTRVGTNVPAAMPPPPVPPPRLPATAPANPPAPPKSVPANSPPPANPASKNIPQTNAAPPMAVATPPVNTVVSSPQNASPPAAPAGVETLPANAAPSAPTPASGGNKGRLLAVVVGLLVIAGVLVFLLLRPRRRGSSSLITESMKKK